MEFIYGKAVETECDCVQFKFKTVKVETNETIEGQNGNKKAGIYDEKGIKEIFLPRYIGFSAADIRNYGTRAFYSDKEMCSVWRFLYRRSVIIDNNILFPKNIHLGEDTMFNCEFLCYAERVCVIDDVLYTYYSKASGAMLTSLRKLDTLLKNKKGGVEERQRLRKLYKDKHAMDIFPLYAGSLFLSAVELAVKFSFTMKGMGYFLEYTKMKEVRKSIDLIPMKGNLKIKLILFLFKLRMFRFAFVLIYCANKTGLKLQ